MDESDTLTMSLQTDGEFSTVSELAPVSQEPSTFSDVIWSTVESPPGGSGSDDIKLDGILNGVFGGLMTLVTFTGQIIVFVVVSRDHRLRTPSNYFIISLAMADFLISIVSMPTWTVYATLGRWPFSQNLCDIWNILDYILCMVSIYTILFMSVDRYLSLKFPFTYRVKRTSGRAKIALALIWVCTSIVYGAYIWVSQIMLGKGHRDPDSCSTYYLTSIPLTVIMVTFAHWTGVFGTALLYVLVYNIATQASRVHKSFIAPNTEKTVSTINVSSKDVSCVEDVSVETTLSSDGSNASNQQQQKKKGISATPGKMQRMNSKKVSKDDKDAKAMKTIALLLVTFAICWLPLSFIFLLEAIKPGYLNPWWMIGGYWMGYVNSMLNPVCYAVGNPYFKETLWKLCGSRK